MIDLISYNKLTFSEVQISDPHELTQKLEARLPQSDTIIWISVTLDRDDALLNSLRSSLSLNSMLVKYLKAPDPRARFDNFGDYQLLQNTFLLVENDRLISKNVSMVIGSHIVLTFQNGHSDVFKDVKAKLRSGDLRQQNLDYLIYSFLDSVITSYHQPTERLGSALDELEEEVIRGEVYKETFVEIHQIGRQFLSLYRAIWREREALTDFIHGSEVVAETTNSYYLRNCYDRVVELIEIIDTYRDVAKTLMSTYLSTTNNKMNEAMKMLSIMVGIFAPITTIASVYGMNFHYMPELEQVWGYPAVLLIMALSSAGLLAFFFKRGYLADPSKKGKRHRK